jgi:membrane protein implicated in regulation of membrane protease activity
MVIPGTVLVIVGIIGAIYPSMMESWWSPVIAVAIAVPIAIVTTKVYQRLAVPEPPVTTVADSLVGRKGIVVVSTESGNMKGKVKVGSEVWSATSDEPLEAGVEVIIERSEGVHVHVRELTED